MHLLFQDGLLLDELAILISKLLLQGHILLFEGLNLLIFILFTKERMQVVRGAARRQVRHVEGLSLQVDNFGYRVASVEEWVVAQHCWSAGALRLRRVCIAHVIGRLHLFLHVVLLGFEFGVFVDYLVDPVRA